MTPRICSFCHRTDTEVKVLVAGDDVAICERCAGLAYARAAGHLAILDEIVDRRAESERLIEFGP